MTRIALDANILLLLVIGRATGAVNSKRLRQYTNDDIAILDACLEGHERLVVCPHVLTEVSNIARFGLEDEWRTSVPNYLAALLQLAIEVREPSKDIVRDPEFIRLGLADCALLNCLDPDTTLVTDDIAVHQIALSRGLRAVNFTELRTFD
jgi:hypothetical protein